MAVWNFYHTIINITLLY